jgi:hypothetical protein
MALKSIQYVPELRGAGFEDPHDPSAMLHGPARALVGLICGTADKPVGEVIDEFQRAFDKQEGRPVGLEQAKEILTRKFPQLGDRIDDFACKLEHLEPKVLSDARVEIELVTTVDLPTDAGTIRRWSCEPLTAFLDLSDEVKGVIVENASNLTNNGQPLVVCTIQRGNDDWLADLASLELFDFTGFRTDPALGPQTAADALEGMRQRVIRVPMRGDIVQGTQPVGTLYDFGCVVRLTALDQHGQIVAVANVRPNNLNRAAFNGHVVKATYAQTYSAQGPNIDLDRIDVETRIVAPPEKRAELLALAANIPRMYVRMEGKIGCGAIQEAGAAVELDLGGAVVSAKIPWSRITVPANRAVESGPIHNNIVGKTLADMLARAATVNAEGTNEEGAPRGDGAARAMQIIDLALKERKRIVIGGVPLSTIAYDNQGGAIPVEAGKNVQDQLEDKGLRIRDSKRASSTDRVFEVTIAPPFVDADETVMVDVGYYRSPTEFVWAKPQGREISDGEPGLVKLEPGQKQTFKISVPESVYMSGDQNTPAKMQVRLFRPGQSEMFLGSVFFDMKQIGRSNAQLSRADELFEEMERYRAQYQAAVPTAQAQGKIIAEGMGERSIMQVLEANGSWSFIYNNRTFTVDRNPETGTPRLMEGANVINANPDCVHFQSSGDVSVPEGFFVVSLEGIAPGHAMYASHTNIRVAPYPLAGPAEGDPLLDKPQEFRRQELLKLAADGVNALYPDLLWAGIEARGVPVQSQEALDKMLGAINLERLKARRGTGKKPCEKVEVAAAE